MLFNSNLIPPAEGKAQTWRYSYVELVCKNEMTACSPSVTSPYGGGTCYYSLRMGWESQYAQEGQTCFGIYKHRGYSDGTPISFAVNRTDINISDGKDHYLEMTVKDVQNEEGTKGVNIIVRLDGDLIFDFEDYDRKITETVTIDGEVISVEYDWKASGMTGWIGIASISDYTATLPEEERPGSFTIKEYYITKYDEENPEGVMVERAKVEFEPPTPGDYGDPDGGRDPADNQSAGLPVNVDSNNGCNSRVRAESALIALPLLAVSFVILTVKRRRGRKVK